MTYTPKRDQYMTLEDGTEVFVEYEVWDYGSEPSGLFGPPENYDPGSGPDLGITRVSEPESNVEIVITDEERERLEQIIIDNPDWWYSDPADYYEDY